MILKRFVSAGAILLIILSIAHAVHVGRSDDVEPYLWLGSLFLLTQGLLTVAPVRRRERPISRAD